jgi:hypothetical protein
MFLLAQVLTAADPTSAFLSNLGVNGPWAAMSGFLLWQVIKAWNGDRAQLNLLITGMNATLVKLSNSVDGLSVEQRKMSEVLERMQNERAA